jgi:hypothetical protein
VGRVSKLIFNFVPKVQDTFSPSFEVNVFIWVVCKLITFARLLKADLNGASYRNDLKQTVAKGQHHLSRAAWLYELEMADDDAAA